MMMEGKREQFVENIYISLFSSSARDLLPSMIQQNKSLEFWLCMLSYAAKIVWTFCLTQYI